MRISKSTCSAEGQLLLAVTVFPAGDNTLSDLAQVVGIARYFFASFVRMGNCAEFNFHQ